MTDNDRIVCQVLEQQLSLRLREGCRDVLLHLLPAPLRGLLYIALRSSAAGYARLWVGTSKATGRHIARSERPVCLPGQDMDRPPQSWPLFRVGRTGKREGSYTSPVRA